MEHWDEDQIKKDIPKLENLVINVELKLKAVAKFFECSDGTVSHNFDFDQSSGIGRILDEIIIEVNYIYILVNSHMCEISNKEYMKKYGIQVA